MNRSEPSHAICPVCTEPVPNTASFCTRCGSSLSRCPICAMPVLTGPTTCTTCGTQLSLPKRKPNISQASKSMKLPEATIFFKPPSEAQAAASPVQQELSQHVPIENRQILATSESLRNELLTPLIPIPPPHEVASEEKREQVIAQTNGFNRVGQQLGNYRLIRFLGEGGFADVYLGEHIHLESQAAIKVLRNQLTSEDIHLFRTEARTLVRLVHPHIVRVLDFGIEDKTPFLVMDYAPNGTLRRLHPKGKPLPLTTVVSYVKQVADALQFAHDKKIIHRDIKPENMLVGSQNDILLSDFGIATVVQSSRYQNAQDMAGTIAYMAPEQIQAHPRLASDQYSLGVVVYEWLCGERPFRGSFKEIAIKHTVVSPPPLHERVPTLPAAVEEVVLKALAKDPKDRFESVRAFGIAFEQAI